jgi:hypothetical protein
VGFRFWTQYTRSWVGPAVDLKNRRAGSGPETIWDSTRGAEIGATDPETGQVRPFALARGSDSLSVPSDDVFPEIVEVTLVVEPDVRRAVRTDLVDPMTEGDTIARVASTKGFMGPKSSSGYLLIGNEWVRYVEKTARTFRISKRGQRGTARGSHAIGTKVRIGETFVMRFHVPGYREDWSTEVDFLEKIKNQ